MKNRQKRRKRKRRKIKKKKQNIGEDKENLCRKS